MWEQGIEGRLSILQILFRMVQQTYPSSVKSVTSESSKAYQHRCENKLYFGAMGLKAGQTCFSNPG